MYRIKLNSGEEAVYNSIDALAVAVRSGEVTPDALIYHRRADRWLAIATHPHYQTIQARSAAPAEPAAPASSRPAPPPAPPAPVTAPERTSQEAENELAVESRDAVIQAKVQRLREMQRPLAEPRNGLNRAAEPRRETPAPEEAVTEADAPDVRGHTPDVAPPEVEPSPAPASEADTPEPVADLPLLEVGDLHEPVPLPDMVMAPAGEPASGSDLDFTPAAAPAGPRRRLPVGLLVATVVTIAAGIGVIAWHPWNRTSVGDSVQTLASTSPSPTGLPSGATSEPVPPVEDTARMSSIVAPEIPSAPEPARRDADSIPTARAPRPPALQMDLNAASAALEPGVGSGTQITISPTALAGNYAAAYARAQDEMNARLGQIGFTDLFDGNRLGSTDKVQSARRILALAGATIRQYRERESRIEQAYRDTLNQVGKRLALSEQEIRGWDKRKILKESAESARMVDDLLAQIDNVYGLIIGEEGRYQVKGSSIVFSSPETARRYGTLRTAITPRMNSWSNTPPADLPASLRPVVKAIGSTRLPLETT